MSTEYLDDEYGDSLEEDDYGLEDEIDELEEALEISDINATIRNLEAAHGAPFTQDEIQQIGELIDEGHDPQAVYEYVAPANPGEEAFDNQFIQTVEHVQEQQGRPLAQSEVDSLYDKATYLNDPRHVEDEAIRDMTKKQDRIAHANERIAQADPPEEAPEVIQPLGPDATSKERIAFLDARHNGAEVDTDTYEGEE